MTGNRVSIPWYQLGLFLPSDIIITGGGGCGAVQHQQHEKGCAKQAWTIHRGSVRPLVVAALRARAWKS